MPTPTPIAPPLRFDPANAGGGARRPAAVLDLDTMARIAEEAGRDAIRGRAARAASDAVPALRAATAGDIHVTATDLYRACHRGATDPATD